MDKKKLGAPAKVYDARPTRSDWDAKGDRADKSGKGDKIYQSPEFRRAVEDVSSEFQSRSRADGKRSREDSTDFGSRNKSFSDALQKKYGKK